MVIIIEHLQSFIVLYICDHAQLHSELTGLTVGTSRARGHDNSAPERAHESAVPKHASVSSTVRFPTHIQLYQAVFKGVLDTCTSTEE